jgi:hypothetical protein
LHSPRPFFQRPRSPMRQPLVALTRWRLATSSRGGRLTRATARWRRLVGHHFRRSGLTEQQADPPRQRARGPLSVRTERKVPTSGNIRVAALAPRWPDSTATPIKSTFTPGVDNDARTNRQSPQNGCPSFCFCVGGGMSLCERGSRLRRKVRPHTSPLTGRMRVSFDRAPVASERHPYGLISASAFHSNRPGRVTENVS